MEHNLKNVMNNIAWSFNKLKIDSYKAIIIFYNFILNTSYDLILIFIPSIFSATVLTGCLDASTNTDILSYTSICRGY